MNYCKECCTDSIGEGMMKLLQSALIAINVNITRNIGNATDGASKYARRVYKFTSWLSKTVPEKIHVWCYRHVLN